MGTDKILRSARDWDELGFLSNWDWDMIELDGDWDRIGMDLGQNWNYGSGFIFNQKGFVTQPVLSLHRFVQVS